MDSPDIVRIRHPDAVEARGIADRVAAYS